MKKKSSHDGRRPERAGAASTRALYGLDMGHEPPLDPSGSDAQEVDRREVNRRWLGACVLTGLTGGALIGASIYIALEGITTRAAPPERVVGAFRSLASDDRPPAASRKGDRLVRPDTVAPARQGFRAPMTIRTADREVIKIRQFVRLATSLSLTAGTFASDIPPFNPLRLIAEDNGERFVESSPEISDADVSFVRRDLAGLTIDPSAPALSDSDVVAQIEEERRLLAEAGRRSGVPMGAQLMLSRTLRQPHEFGEALGSAHTSDLFKAIEVRVIPDNVSILAKADARGPDLLIEEHDIALKKGETLESVLRVHGAGPDQIRSITTALGARMRMGPLPEGQRMRILVAPHPKPDDAKRIVRVVLFGERGVEGIAALNDRGVFVSVTPPNDLNDARRSVPQESAEESEDDEGGVRLYDSLYETTLKNEVPRQTVDDLVRIFGYDVDFQRRVAAGDMIELFYAVDDEGGGAEVLYAALSVGGEARRVYRFQAEDGSVDYFDEAGRSLKKFLLRKPIAEGIFRSGFGMRRHPILGYSRMHTGVDWSDRIGTPIMSAGAGTVLKAEWDSGGYGRRVEVQHANGYVTAYSHLSRFAVTAGAKVRQGQVIGYVGSTGLSTGPHLHYEVIVNGHFVDPMKIRLPRGRELDGRAMAEFKRQREQVDSLIERAGHTRLAERAEGR